MGVTNTKREFYNELKGNKKTRCCDPIPQVNEIMLERISYYRRLGIGLYRWEVPKEYPLLYKDAPRIERYLYDDGFALIWMNNGELMITKGVAYGVGQYFEPDKFRPVWYDIAGNRVVGDVLGNDECVIIQNNEDLVPSENLILPWVKRYAQIQATIDNNIMFQNFPVVIEMEEEKDLEAKIIGNVLETFQRMIINHGTGDILKKLEVINLNVPYLADKLRMERDDADANVLQILGVNNVNIEKKERLLVAEAESNNEELELTAHAPYQLRTSACERAKELFGVEIECIRNSGGVRNGSNIRQESELFDNVRRPDNGDR